MLEMQRWFLESGNGSESGCMGLPVCRVKNKFSRSAAVTDGYRDLSLSVIVAERGDSGCGEGGLRIIGEVQIHDRAMHNLKLQVLCPLTHPHTWKHMHILGTH